MSVIIRLQNLPWSANALDIRNFFRGLSIPEGGVHIVGGELGDAFIAFSTDEDARQAMMLDGGKVKEIQVKLYLSSRSEMHKVIETARQTVPIMSLTASANAPAAAPLVTPFSAALNSLSTLAGIPGLGTPQDIPQPAVIEAPLSIVSPDNGDSVENVDADRKKSKDRERRRSWSRSRSRSSDRRKDRKRDRRDRTRSRERRRRDRSRSRDRRDRKRNNRSRSRERSPRRIRDARKFDSKSPPKPIVDLVTNDIEDATSLAARPFANDPDAMLPGVYQQMMMQNNANAGAAGNGVQNQAKPAGGPRTSRFSDPDAGEAFSKLQELGKKRNPNAFQGGGGGAGDQNGGGPGRFPGGRGGGAPFRREAKSRFEDERPRQSCVAVRGAPTHTSYGDVRRFFPFLIDKHGIKMINDQLGRRTGTILVRFCDERSRQLALQRRSNELKGQSVAVEPVADEEYDAAQDSFLPFREENGGERATEERPAPFRAIRVSDLPFFVKEHDVMKAFSDFSLLSIQLSEDRQSRTKIALVQFAKPEDASLALERRASFLFGRRQAVLEAVADEDFEGDGAQEPEPVKEPAAPPPLLDLEGPRDPRQRRGPTAPVALAGSAPQMPPAPFFGPPFAQQPFAGNMGGPPRFGFNEARGGGNGGGGWNPRAPQPADLERDAPDCALVKGLPAGATDRSIVAFFSEAGAVPARIHLMLDAAGAPSGDCFCEFRTAAAARAAVSRHGHLLDGSRVTVDLVPHSLVDEALEGPAPRFAPPLLDGPPGPGPGRGGFVPRGGGFRGRGARGEMRGMRGSGMGRGRGAPRGRGGRGGLSSGGDDGGVDDFGAPGCVVSMENVPFRAMVDDILEFFADFELSQDDVIRRYNERGQPTGDARVSFRTPFDAQRAVKTRHMDMIIDRRISLALL